MTDDGRETAKRAAAESAVEAIEDGMVVGLGSGSTAAEAIRAIGRAVDAGLDVSGVPTSFQARVLARDVGVPLTDLDAGSVDVAIDGADQVAGTDLVKGGGGAHVREKVVDAAADRFLVVVDDAKETDVLDHPVPLAVLPDARTTVADRVEELGGEPTLRQAERKSGPVVTDDGNLLLDCEFGAIADPKDLAGRLSRIPGVVDHGLFVGVADEVHVGSDGGVRIRTE